MASKTAAEGRVRRVLILGSSGSGKSTTAETLSARWGLPYVPTDRAYWTQDWKPAPQPQVRAWIEAETAREAWVLDGNFDIQRDLVWGRADLAVWIDLPVWLTTLRVARRNLGWMLKRRRIWNDQRMTLRKAWSGVLHALRSNGLKRRTYPAMLAEFPNLKVVRLRSPGQVARWLAAQKRREA